MGCRTTDKAGIFVAHFPDELFPQAWCNRPTPVFFDFQDVEGNGDDPYKDALWCLLPKQQRNPSQPRILVGVRKSDLIKFATKADDQGNLFQKLKIINNR